MLHIQRVSEMTKGIIHTTHPNLVSMNLVRGMNERIGLEGLELMMSNRGALPRR